MLARIGYAILATGKVFMERIMRRSLITAVAAFSALLISHPAAIAGEDAADSIQGVWIAKSMEANGKSAPEEVVNRLRFTFKDDKLLVKGNFDDGREEECSFTIDPERSPKHLNFSPPREKKPVLGIYELKNDELRLCMRHGNSSEGRPTEFATKEGTELVLIVFKKLKESE